MEFLWVGLGVALALGATTLWRRAHSPTAMAVRRLTRQARIVELEKGVGMSVSYPDADLPTLRVRRNPAGDWLMGDRWEVDGAGFESCRLSSATKGGAIANAQNYLKALAQSKAEGSTEVRL